MPRVVVARAVGQARAHRDRACAILRAGGAPTGHRSSHARRAVRIVKPLRAILDELPRDHDLVLPGGRGGRFSAEALLCRSRERWLELDLAPVGLHDCRHCAASYAIASCANLKALSVSTAHASVTITADRYGHLLPGAEEAVGAALDALAAEAELA